MMIDKKIHRERRWKAEEIAADFDLWDVWEINLAANNSKNENFRAFQGVLTKSFKHTMEKYSLTSLLFSLRKFLGKFIDLDKNINCLPIPGCTECSVKSRMALKDKKRSKPGLSIKDRNTGLEFLPVYLFKNESLFELSNDTVHALVHLGWLKKTDNHYNATLAIYVKPRGTFGRIYLKVIEPFRHHIVYPFMIKVVKKQWQLHLGDQKKQGYLAGQDNT